MAHNIFRIDLTDANAVTIVEHYHRIAPIFENMEFYSKLKAIQSLKLLPNTLVSLASMVNDHRKYFSHPATYRNEINEYKKPEKQLETLRDLVKALEAFDKFLLDNQIVIKK